MNDARAWDEEPFGRRVRVRTPLPACGQRVFMWCEERPTVCETHGYRHGGDLWTSGHHPEEAGITGEIIAHLGGMNHGHPWIVRYDRLLVIRWTDGQLLRVNSGTYARAELEEL